MPELTLLIDEAQDVLGGESPAATRLRSQVERISRTPRTTVLLLGQRGLELELVARCIHLRSNGRGAFLPIGGRSLSDQPAQVDVFGCSGGLCERAIGGTLFLDEVSDLNAALQSDLLRRLEERPGPKPAENSSSALEPRIVASTALDLDALVRAGQFRSDLFYRLNVLTIRVPNLEQRSADIELLATGILRRHAAQTGRLHTLGPGSLELLRAHAWPGNLFELECVLAQAALRVDGISIRPEQLSAVLHAEASEVLLPAQRAPRSIRASEEALIRRVLHEEAGNRSSAARALGINRTTLYNKLRQYGIA